MISFQTAVVPLLLGSFLIVIGNTGFPCMLRLVIWIASLIVPHKSGVWEEFKFLLDHPRRCFTLLFPTQATWWLFWILVILNGLDLIFFIVLDVSSTKRKIIELVLNFETDPRYCLQQHQPSRISCLERLISSCQYPHRRHSFCQLSRSTPWYTSFLSYHDVHFCLSNSHLCQAHKCL